MDFDLQQVLFLLGPNSGEMIWNILLYIIFFLALITMFNIPDKNLLPTLLMAGTLLLTVISKLNISITPRRDAIFPPEDFIQFTVNVAIFIFPLLTAGMIRAKKKGKVVGPAIVTALFGGAYFFIFWFFVQRGG